jgi:hypothetical protein
VLAITDHWQATSHEHNRVTVIASSELSACLPEQELEEAEVLTIGVGVLPERREHFATVEECATRVRQQGGVPFLAHLFWSGLSTHTCWTRPVWPGSSCTTAAASLPTATGCPTSCGTWSATPAAPARRRHRRLPLPRP